jgi:hypothetical protein
VPVLATPLPPPAAAAAAASDGAAPGRAPLGRLVPKPATGDAWPSSSRTYGKVTLLLVLSPVSPA